MTIRTFNWCTDEELECAAAFPLTAFFCVPSSIVSMEGIKSQNSFVTGTIDAVRTSTCADSCGPCGWVYTLSYDDEQLIPGYQLVQQNINAVLCNDCLLNIIIIILTNLPALIQQIVDEELASHGNIIARETIDLNDPTVQEIIPTSANYFLVQNRIYITNASTPPLNAVISFYRDAALTEKLLTYNLTFAFLTPLELNADVILVPYDTMRRTEPVIYVTKDVLEGSPATVEVLFVGFRLD